MDGIVFLAPALREIYEDKYIAKKIGKFMACFTPKSSLVPQTFNDRTRFKMEEILKEDKNNYAGNHVFGTAVGVL